MAEKLNKDAVYRAAKTKDKDYFINDGGGLFLMVKTNGTKLWHFIFTCEGKRKRLSLGIYPDTTLEVARRKSEEARTQIADGIDPAEVRDQAKQIKQLSKQNQARIKEGLPSIDSFADVTFGFYRKR
ncbi:Arm DNA-binding domain-containing protein [Methylomonas rivi]|uniref:Arm DNA-binding domain-containing protein n=1 Tax=Methylomonas rivi TaxID=2952226 RepID=A0ABT1U5E2_9GAMM|nr:Arm DNA-binding domain-containing protein [Methylomonas sp. WSC-6]MCQ8128316.1 Arm DNA-binding domain-containing protein [Methylomonas sp. WSC-6]